MLAGHAERVVSLLLTDIEGSTAAWDAAVSDMALRLEEHDRLVREVVEHHGGRLIKSKGEGDSTFSVFDSAHQAVAAAVELQLRLAEAAEPLRVRAGIHIGPVQERDGDFFGPVPNTAARVRGTAHGGQVVVTDAVAAQCEGRLPDDIELRPLGTFRLRDLSAPVRLHQAVHPGLQERFPPLRSVELPGSQLPSPPTPLIGREDVLRDLVKELAQERLVTLTGLGGIGKTRLALAAAEATRGSFDDGVWWVELAPLSRGGSVAAAVAAGIGASEGRSGQSEQQRVIDRLRPAKALVVLDNCEHVVEDVAALAETILRECPGVRLLATSREPLEVPGEIQIQVQPLATGDAGAPAVRLLIERAGRPLDSAVALDLCRRLDGIPLAIELAAAQVAVLGASQLQQHLSGALLEARRRAGPERHRSLRAALDSSYELLDDDTARALRTLSVFPAEFSLEGASALLGRDALPAVIALGRASLLVPEHDRFRMLETVRRYAYERLEEAGEVSAVMEALLAWAFSLRREEQEAVVRAIGWAFETGRIEDAVRLVVFRRPAWLASGWTVGQRWVRQARAAHGGGELAARLAALDAELTRRSAALEEAEAIAEEACRLAAERNDALAEAEALSTLLGIRLMSDDLEDAERVGAEAVARARTLGEVGLLGTVLNHLGAVAATAGDFPLAAERWRESVEVLRTAGDRSALPATLNNLAFAAYRALRLDEAQELAEEALRVAQEAGVEGPIAFGIGVLGRVAYERGDLDEAQQLLEEALLREQRLRGSTGAAHTASPLIGLFIERGELEKAASVLGEWTSAMQRLRGDRASALVLLYTADLAAAKGDRAHAHDLLREVVELTRNVEIVSSALLRLAELEIERDATVAAQLVATVAGANLRLQRVDRAIYDRLVEHLEELGTAVDHDTALSPDEVAELVGQLVSQIQWRSGS